MEYQELPLSRRRKSKHKKNKKLLFIIYLFFLLLAILIFFNSPVSKITDIQVTGISLISEKQVFEQAEVNIGSQYLFTSTSVLEKKLLDLKQIKSVQATKIFPGKLIIDIVEQKTIAYLGTTNGWVPLLENGYLHQIGIGQIYLNRPIITNWQDDSIIADLALELAQVKMSTLIEISEIQQNLNNDDPNRLLMYTRDGYTLHILLQNINTKLAVFPAIMEELRAKGKKPGNIYLLESFRYEEY